MDEIERVRQLGNSGEADEVIEELKALVSAIGVVLSRIIFSSGLDPKGSSGLHSFLARLANKLKGDRSKFLPSLYGIDSVVLRIQEEIGGSPLGFALVAIALLVIADSRLADRLVEASYEILELVWERAQEIYREAIDERMAEESLPMTIEELRELLAHEDEE